jgi:monovalent cation/hydrogen antiporter
VPAAVDLLGLLLVTVAVAALAHRRGVSAPLALTGVGVVLSFVPGMPDYTIDPELVLVGILPPLLYATALRIPLVDLRRNRAPIGLLSVALVLFTAGAVALVAHWVLPDLPFPAALALGAVVAPPDAVAATAVARQVAMPRRVITLLEGESLLNDATALVALRTAVAALAGAATALGAAGDLLWAVVGGVAIGWLVATVVSVVRRRIDDPVQDTAIALLVPYLAYLPAEELNASGVLAVVVCGLILGHRSTEIQSAGARVTERVLWRTVQFLLESAVFLLIGLQLKRLADAARASEVANGRIAVLCAAVLATVVAARFVWVFLVAWVLRRLPTVSGPEPSPWRDVAVLSWAGMRGVVTMAAAFSLPVNLRGREALTITAFVVVAGTLLIQGSSLTWLVRRLGVRGPDPAQDALQQALVTQRAVQAGLDRLDELVEETHDQAGVADRLRSWSTRLAEAGWERLGRTDPGRETPAAQFRRLRVGMLEAERRTLVEVRRSGAVPHDVVSGVLERIDDEEAMLSGLSDAVVTTGERATLVPDEAETCDHLRAAKNDTSPRTVGVCESCVAIGEREWVHLRMCLTCGLVGCCDSSPRRHAEAHHQESGHPVIRSVELGEAWRWCFVDELLG